MGKIERGLAAAMTLTPSIRKLTLTAHVTAAVGWVGALSVFFAHALAGVVSDNERVVRATSLAMGLTAWLVIMPLSIATLVTGLVQALGTAWGLLRHYWVLFKLSLTAIATAVLLLKMQPISYLADAAAQTGFSGGDLVGLRTSLAVHAAGGLVVLLTALVLAIYKPAGLTPFAGQTPGAPAAGIPRWAKILGLVLAAFVALVAAMSLFGAHGPGAH
jgi:hypothetical protein